MMMGKRYWLAGGTFALIVLTIGWFALASRPQPEFVEIDINRDVCISKGTEPRDINDVRGELIASPFLQKNVRSDEEHAWLARILELMQEHNAMHQQGKYLFLGSSAGRMRGPRYRALANGIICRDMDTKQCRNRNFWFFKWVPPKQVAEIVFRNTMLERPELRDCPF